MDPRVVFVKTVVYHALGTLMPYPFEDPPWRISVKRFPLNSSTAHLCAPVSFPLGREASITSHQRPNCRASRLAIVPRPNGQSGFKCLRINDGLGDKF